MVSKVQIAFFTDVETECGLYYSTHLGRVKWKYVSRAKRRRPSFPRKGRNLRFSILKCTGHRFDKILQKIGVPPTRSREESDTCVACICKCVDGWWI